jgi:hypothetical protein
MKPHELAALERVGLIVQGVSKDENCAHRVLDGHSFRLWTHQLAAFLLVTVILFDFGELAP